MWCDPDDADFSIEYDRICCWDTLFEDSCCDVVVEIREVRLTGQWV